MQSDQRAAYQRQMGIERRSASPARQERVASPPPPPAPQCVTLNHGEHNDSVVFRFEKGTVVHLTAGPSLLGRRVLLYTNYVPPPKDGGTEPQFVRTQYRPLEWRAWRPDAEEDGGKGEGGAGDGDLVTDTDMYCELRLERPGSFHYYFAYDNDAAGEGPRGSGYLQVAPTLRCGPLPALSCLTLLAPCLGPAPRWPHAAAAAHAAGYNAVHFTPLQTRGASGSAYCLSDQLHLDPGFEMTHADLERFLDGMRSDYNIMSVSDIVLNHTANESPWLQTNPESAYSAASTPRLRPAALLDAALLRAGAALAGRELCDEGALEGLRPMLEQRIAALRLHELFICDVDAVLADFAARAANRVPSPAAASGSLKLEPDPQYRRRAAAVDIELALRLYNLHWDNCPDEASRVSRSTRELRTALDSLVAAATETVRGHERAAVNNVLAAARWERLAHDGPRLGAICERHPLTTPYFTWPHGSEITEEAAEATVFGPRGAFVQAHNGWVMGGNALKDFAAEGDVYLRRELIAWGDSVKLRYGSCPEDNPFLWSHMRDYVVRAAELFDGVRLDNCHSTPLHVAEHMLDAARDANPDLLVVAELFTDSDLVDNVFVNRLGITALIREAMSASESRELGRLLHRFASSPVGSLRGADAAAERRTRAPATVAPALLMDVTHDNESPLATRSPRHSGAVAALLAAAAAAIGSTRGVDELVPHRLDVVTERRLYPAAAAAAAGAGAEDMVPLRRELSRLHLLLANEGYSEIYVDQIDDDVIAVTRHNPTTRESVILVAFTEFSPRGEEARALPPLRFEGELAEILLWARLERKGECAFTRHAQYINGLQGWTSSVRARPAECGAVGAAVKEGVTTAVPMALRPGEIVALRVRPSAAAAAAIRRLNASALSARAELSPLLRSLPLAAFNDLLYRTDGEERAVTGGSGAYDVPNHGTLIYAGLTGPAAVLESAVRDDDLAHPICDNLRNGVWLANYCWQRLNHPGREALAPVSRWLQEALAPLAEAPAPLRPRLAAQTLLAAAAAARDAATAHFAPWVRRGCALTRALALTSVQLVGHVPEATLPAAAGAPSLAAGLPHFALGYMRCWGRDTFISLRGLLLLTGRYEDARNHIIGFAAAMRHGLIPNLLDGGARARFNCRDAVWWWLLSVRDYCQLAPDGGSLLSAPLPRLFPTDDSPALDAAAAAAAARPLCDAVQHALERHFQGCVFRERGAGPAIDEHMGERGFTVQYGVDPETGFVFGGNDANCGTWMDKMGSSDRGTKGKPATPRDGSAVELVALCHAVVSWLAAEHAAGRYPYEGVARRHPDGSATAWSWAAWAERVRKHFDRHFWVGEPGAADAQPHLVHRRNIYKDTYGASSPWADYQLRCNYPVAMAVAPALFPAARARAALESAALLAGPLGMKTLDPADWAYRPRYDPADDGADLATVHGYNYHQGPEWLWPLGCYLRARLLHRAAAAAPAREARAVWAALRPLAARVAGPWRGLPELDCVHACDTQAWSSATVLEVLYELRKIERARPLNAA